MAKYYHVTSVDNLESIMRDGLVPKVNYHLADPAKQRPNILAAMQRSPFLEQAIMDPRTYLWDSPKKALIGPGQIVLEIELGPNVPIQRDYEQVSFAYLASLIGHKKGEPFLENEVMQTLGSKRKVSGISFTRDFRAMYAAVDNASESIWRGSYGAYQTKGHIPPGSIRFPSPAEIKDSIRRRDIHAADAAKNVFEETRYQRKFGWDIDLSLKRTDELLGLIRYACNALKYTPHDNVMVISNFKPVGKYRPEEPDLQQHGNAILDKIIAEAQERGAQGIAIRVETDAEKSLLSSRGFQTQIWNDADTISHVLDLRKKSK